MHIKIIIVLLMLLLAFLVFPRKDLASELKIEESTLEELIVVSPLTLEQHIQRIFGDKSQVAMAVLKHESGLKLDAKNWNCIYGGKSTFCKPEDRHLAWSVDCGIAQINIKGKICPDNLMTLEGNMKEVERIYKNQGLNAWVSYKTGRYLIHM